jgi:hypothetical protein
VYAFFTGAVELGSPDKHKRKLGRKAYVFETEPCHSLHPQPSYSYDDDEDVDVFQDILNHLKDLAHWVIQNTLLKILSLCWLQTVINHYTTLLFNCFCLTMTSLPTATKIGLAVLVVSIFWPHISQWSSTAYNKIQQYCRSAYRSWLNKREHKVSMNRKQVTIGKIKPNYKRCHYLRKNIERNAGFFNRMIRSGTMPQVDSADISNLATDAATIVTDVLTGTSHRRPRSESF